MGSVTVLQLQNLLPILSIAGVTYCITIAFLTVPIGTTSLDIIFVYVESINPLYITGMTNTKEDAM